MHCSRPPGSASLSSLPLFPGVKLIFYSLPSSPIPFSHTPIPLALYLWKPSGHTGHEMRQAICSVSSLALQQMICRVLSFLFHHFLWSPQNIMADPAFLSPVDSFSLFLSSPSPFPFVSPQYLETNSTQDPQEPYLAGPQKHSLLGDPQPPHGPKIQRGQ